MAFDTAAHMHTVEALESGHLCLTAMGFRENPIPTGLWRFPDYTYGRQLARSHPGTTPNGRSGMSAERTDIVVIGSGFGGAITAYHLAAGGARVVVLERGTWVPSDEFDQGFELGTSSTADLRLRRGPWDERARRQLRRRRQRGVLRHDAARAPVHLRPARAASADGGCGRRPINRDILEPWYDRVAEALPISQQTWDQVSYPGGLWASEACNHRRPDRQPAQCRDRHLAVHQLQLDDGRLPLRREALAAAEPTCPRAGHRTARRSGRCTEVQKISREDDWYRVHLQRRLMTRGLPGNRGQRHHPTPRS